MYIFNSLEVMNPFLGEVNGLFDEDILSCILIYYTVYNTVMVYLYIMSPMLQCDSFVYFNSYKLRAVLTGNCNYSSESSGSCCLAFNNKTEFWLIS